MIRKQKDSYSSRRVRRVRDVAGPTEDDRRKQLRVSDVDVGDQTHHRAQGNVRQILVSNSAES